MEQLVLINGELDIEKNEKTCSLVIDGIKLSFASVRAKKPDFDEDHPANEFRVLVEKVAFSCNYRDKAILLLENNKFLNSKDLPYHAIGFGSEFVAKVVQVGAGVNSLKVGDRVINNGQYPYPALQGAVGGLPTNQASMRFQVFHFADLVKIPDQMSDNVAASFTIGGITSYSMIRKLNVKSTDQILITSARSNTSLFVANALKKYCSNITMALTSKNLEQKLHDIGIKKIIYSLKDNFEIASHRYSVIIDPLYDLNLEKSVHLLEHAGRYVTCGFFDQHSKIIDPSAKNIPVDANLIMQSAIMKNLVIIGNCLGTSQDLDLAISDHVTGSLDVIIDSVFCGNQIQNFIERTYLSKERLGKVVFRYS